jgi:uncharacterized membrane protein YraQ (UPF0718 family)
VKTTRADHTRNGSPSRKPGANIRAYRPVAIMLLIYVVLWIWWPSLASKSTKAFGLSLKEVMLIMPGISVLMGLFEVWVPRSMVEAHMGKDSGLKGFLIAFVFGTAPTGPLYAAFPVARGLVDKGAGVGTITVFLGAWGAAKIPQLMLEARFMGMPFTIARFVLTVVGVGLMGLIVDYVVKPEEVLTLAGATRQEP